MDKITRGTTPTLSMTISGFDITKVAKLFFTVKQRNVVVTKSLEPSVTTREGADPTDPSTDPSTPPTSDPAGDPSTDPTTPADPEPEVESDVKVEGENIFMSLTEEETMRFSTSDRIEAQVRYIDNEGGVFASDIVRYDVKPILYDTPISQ